MDTEIRRLQVDFHQQQLRNEAADNRLARGNQDRAGSPHPSVRFPRTIPAAWRRLVGGTAAA
jgi:hypothetical protein